MVGSASSCSSSNSQVSLISLSLFSIELWMWVSPNPTPRTKTFIDGPSMVPSLSYLVVCLTVDPPLSSQTRGFTSSRCLAAGMSLVDCFVSHFHRLTGHVFIPKSSSFCAHFFLFHSILGPLLFLDQFDPPACSLV